MPVRLRGMLSKKEAYEFLEECAVEEFRIHDSYQPMLTRSELWLDYSEPTLRRELAKLLQLQDGYLKACFQRRKEALSTGLTRLARHERDLYNYYLEEQRDYMECVETVEKEYKRCKEVLAQADGALNDHMENVRTSKNRAWDLIRDPRVPWDRSENRKRRKTHRRAARQQGHSTATTIVLLLLAREEGRAATAAAVGPRRGTQQSPTSMFCFTSQYLILKSTKTLETSSHRNT